MQNDEAKTFIHIKAEQGNPTGWKELPEQWKTMLIQEKETLSQNTDFHNTNFRCNEFKTMYGKFNSGKRFVMSHKQEFYPVHLKCEERKSLCLGRHTTETQVVNKKYLDLLINASFQMRNRICISS